MDLLAGFQSMMMVQRNPYQKYLLRDEVSLTATMKMERSARSSVTDGLSMKALFAVGQNLKETVLAFPFTGTGAVDVYTAAIGCLEKISSNYRA